jgi:eukaryotic-like serine/threonine-protein kinase
VLQAPSDQSDAHISPDGRWVLYVSNESGTDQIYVRSFPESESRFQIADIGGTHPRWRRDGREIVFVAPDSTLTVVEVEHGPTFRSGRPEPLVRLHDITAFDMRPGAEQFLIPTPVDERSRPELQVIVNWMTELRP